ncbi:hypothetical protein [Luedemannella helvata]|uniref:Uncharacterized protein n=1 Tax=Luedemannella helvata TaxID=349315 RepID=A0ABP4XE64_9ACTN
MSVGPDDTAHDGPTGPTPDEDPGTVPDGADTSAPDEAQTPPTGGPGVHRQRRGISAGMVHRCLAVIAAMFLLTTMRSLWGVAIEQWPAYGVFMIFTCALAVLLAAAAATVRTSRQLFAVDAAIFLVALGQFATSARTNLVPGLLRADIDVTILVQAAAQSLLEGKHLYGVNHPDAFAFYSSSVNVGGTTTADGLMATDYGYPPLGAVFTSWLTPHVQGMPGSIVAAYLCVALAALLMFFLLPSPLRPAAALTCLLFPRIDDYASSGYPGLMALPFMVIAVAAWPTLGANGRLRWRGLLSAVGLGLAMSTHQLPWFVAPFLVVGILLVRWGHLGGLRAALLTLRYAVATVVVFFAVNATFIVQDPAAWLAGITEPLTQKSVPHGQGVVGFISFYTYGSGSLSALGAAGMAMLLGLLVVFALFIRRLAPAAVILPWLAFWFALRSQDSYYVLMAPLWVLGVATWVHRRWFTQAYQLRLALPRVGGDRLVRLAASAVLPVVALAAVGVALSSPPPLTMAVNEMYYSPAGALWRVDATVTNTSRDTLTPKFAVTSGRATIGRLWSPAAGPQTLAPGQSAEYALITPGTGTAPAVPPEQLILRAVTAEPMTLSSIPLNVFNEDLQVAMIGPVLTAPLRPGETYAGYLQLKDNRRRDLRIANVRVTMTATWLSSGMDVDQAVTVNGAPIVAGEWVGVTDSQGQIRIALSSALAQPEPIVFRTTKPKSISYLSLFWRG